MMDLGKDHLLLRWSQLCQGLFQRWLLLQGAFDWPCLSIRPGCLACHIHSCELSHVLHISISRSNDFPDISYEPSGSLSSLWQTASMCINCTYGPWFIIAISSVHLYINYIQMLRTASCCASITHAKLSIRPNSGIGELFGQGIQSTSTGLKVGYLFTLATIS